MKKLYIFFPLLLMISCNQNGANNSEKIITVSIPPFKYFIKAIGGNDFTVNIMVPAGSNPHIYEPVPEQIASLRKSLAYISDGYLGFEMTWLDRFYETNNRMKKLSLGDKIDLIRPAENLHSENIEGADPHYWISPKCGLIIAAEVKSLLIELNPEKSDQYEVKYNDLVKSINDIDNKAIRLFEAYKDRKFMIFHPTLSYFARDYGLKEIAVENEGKEPTPSSLRELIDVGKANKIRVIFVQREYDTKNASSIAAETGAILETIDPLSEDWAKSVEQIIDEIYKSFETEEQ
jgi:zinc transport system substrate-binding protein